MRKKRQVLFIIAVVVLLMGKICFASEQAEIGINQVYQVAEDTQLRETGDLNAGKTADVEAGTIAVVMEYDGGEWCKVSCGEKTGYIQISELKSLEDTAEIDQEFENVGNDYETMYEEISERQEQKKTSRIWGGVIVLLVVAIFVVGLISAKKSNQEEKESA